MITAKEAFQFALLIAFIWLIYILYYWIFWTPRVKTQKRLWYRRILRKYLPKRKLKVCLKHIRQLKPGALALVDFEGNCDICRRNNK